MCSNEVTFQACPRSRSRRVRVTGPSSDAAQAAANASPARCVQKGALGVQFVAYHTPAAEGEKSFDSDLLRLLTHIVMLTHSRAVVVLSGICKVKQPKFASSTVAPSSSTSKSMHAPTSSVLMLTLLKMAHISAAFLM